MASRRPLPSFTRDREVKIVIGAGLGGSYGLYSQLVAKHIKKHIPGKPKVVVKAMPGAGGLRGLNYTYNAARRDGSVITLIHQEVLIETLLSDDVRFNAGEYNWIGRLVEAPFVGLASSASGIRSLNDARTREVVAGATGLRSSTAIAPEMYNLFSGTKFKIVAGYAESRRMFQALEQGEVDVIAITWLTAKLLHGDRLRDGRLVPIFTVATKRLNELPDIPSISEFARTEEEKLFLNFYASGGMIGRALAYTARRTA